MASEAYYDRAVGLGMEPSVYATEWGAGLSLRPARGVWARQFRRAVVAARVGAPVDSIDGSPSL